jgi:molybdopterin-guanine dinucleotide biosynthesis protein A
MVSKKNITGIILAGGKSSRMGTDKGFLKLNGKTFVQYSIDALKPLVNDIIIVSDILDYDIFGLKRINDSTKNAGPVSGICAGLEASKTVYNLILSCDIPLINSETLELLIDGIDDDSEIIQIESSGKTMPLIALYNKSCQTRFLKLLKENERRLRVAVNTCKTKNVILNEENTMFTTNVNTKDQLKLVEDAYKN